MLITLDISNPPKEQDIIEIPLHFCGGKVVEAGGYGFEERKTGRWINDKGLYRCSTCNELWCHWWASCVPIERMNKIMHFCPNCGAKMEGAEE